MTFGRAGGPTRAHTLSLRGRALRLLSQREHSRAELSAKLRTHCETQEELDALLNDLAANDWLDDKRAADSLVHRQSNKFGSARIRQDLQSKGVSSDLISEALAGLHVSEAARAQVVWQKKFGSLAQSPADRAKQMRFLMTRGFSAGIASQIINGRISRDADSD